MGKAERKIVARVSGGLGNQLFIYAAARRMAIERGAKLYMDHLSAFQTDKFGAIYQLHHFAVKSELAPEKYCFKTSLARKKRELLKGLSDLLPLSRKFIVKEVDFIPQGSTQNPDFKQPLRNLLRLEGYWQAVRYFQPYEKEIREDFRIISPLNAQSQAILADIEKSEAVCLHIRQRRGALHAPGVAAPKSVSQLGFDYYERAVEHIASRVKNPVFYCFGDDPDWLPPRWKFPYPVIFVSHNKEQESAYEDLALMTACKHFVVGNSTFSWWAAWLADNPEKIIIAPKSEGALSWASEPDVNPHEWVELDV